MTRQLGHTYAPAHHEHGPGHGYHGGDGDGHGDDDSDVNAHHVDGVKYSGHQDAEHGYWMMVCMIIMDLHQSRSSS